MVIIKCIGECDLLTSHGERGRVCVITGLWYLLNGVNIISLYLPPGNAR